MKFYATFGFGHTLRDNYVTVEAEDAGAAHHRMHQAYGPLWAFLYTEEDKPQAIDKYNLEEVPFGTPNARR